MFSETSRGNLWYTAPFMLRSWPQKVGSSQRLGHTRLDQSTHGAPLVVASWGGRSEWDHDLKSVQRLHPPVAAY